MAKVLKISQCSEEIERFLKKFVKSEQETVLAYTVLVGISSLSKYQKLTLSQIKSIAKSSQKIIYTEQTITELQEKINDFQKNIESLTQQTIPTDKSDKSTETESVQPEVSKIIKTSKKVDFWNQTEEKENFTQAPIRGCWQKKPELTWMHDFSSDVKKLPVPSQIIRESRISILSSHDYKKPNN